MPAKRIKVPPTLLSWYRVRRRTTGRDTMCDQTHISALALAGIDADGMATPAVIGKLRRYMEQDETYRRRVAIREVTGWLGTMYGDSLDGIMAKLGREAIDALAVKQGLLPEREAPPDWMA